MTRHESFDVRVAPDVEEVLTALAASRGSAATDSQRLLRALRHLRDEGIWARNVQKMQSLDLWELRAGDYRLCFCPVRDSRRLAVGSVARKARRKLPMRQLKQIEKKVHRWRAEVEDTP